MWGGAGLGGERSFGFFKSSRHLTVAGGQAWAVSSDTGLSVRPAQSGFSLPHGGLFTWFSKLQPSQPHPAAPSLPDQSLLSGPAMGAEGTQEWKGFGAGGGVPTHSTATVYSVTKWGEGWLDAGKGSFLLGGSRARARQENSPCPSDQFQTPPASCGQADPANLPGLCGSPNLKPVLFSPHYPKHSPKPNTT